MSTVQGPVHIATWIEENAESFRPPVANKVMFGDSEFITMVVRGPNRRNDFHINPGDELFQQLAGTIRVDIRHPDGTVHPHLVHEGELLLVPAGVPHSPRRPAGSWGLVIERRRRAGELDRIAWYCPACRNLLVERSFALHNIETELKAILDDFAADPASHRCARCGHVLEPAEEITLP
jgi:3-hydroxyanthranilate 3,4-dioxygenase